MENKMEKITNFGNGVMDETVDMWYYSENDATNPKFLGKEEFIYEEIKK